MPTNIEWTQNKDGTKGETWNPVTGCTKISEGCRNCYAQRMAHRLAGRFGYPEAPNEFRVTLHEDRLNEPYRWKKPRMVFVCSMGDLFHEDVPDMELDKIFDRIFDDGISDHIFQILTKRPERMYEYISDLNFPSPVENVWFGVTAENQAAADERIPWLLKTPAAVRFVSVEPMLGHVDLSSVGSYGMGQCMECGGSGYTAGHYFSEDGIGLCDSCKGSGEGPSLDWVICGGETGPGARPMDWHWAESLHQQCLDADVPFFFKRAGDAFEDNPALLPTTRQWPKVVTDAA